MFKKINNYLSQDSLTFSYLPAQLKKNKSCWIIEYWCEDPITFKMRRVRIRVDKIKKRYSTLKEAQAHILKIVTYINIKLMQGWNPFQSQENEIQMFTPIEDVGKQFLEEKNRELRADSIRSYASFMKTFLNYVKTKLPRIRYISQFTKSHASQYMDYIYIDRGVAQRAYNNYLKFCRIFFNWCVSHSFISSNPFENIKSKTKPAKKRILIDKIMRDRITEYLSEHEPQMLVVCKLMYYCLLRPKEIVNLRVRDVDFVSGTIRVSESVSKNHKTRYAAMTDDVINSLEYIKNYKADYYLISRDWLPSPTKAWCTKFSRYWYNLRPILNIPEEMQLYSFRDTGIFEMLKSGVDPLSVKQHADHHSLSMTSIYSDHADPNLAHIIREKSPDF